MIFRNIVVLISVVAAACSAPPIKARTTVSDVTQHIHVWNNKIVIIDGWLGKCKGYDCEIFDNKADEDAESNYLHFHGSKPVSPGLFIGSSSIFDKAAEPLQHSRVLLKAVVNDKCYPYNCVDRADILIPVDIQPWQSESIPLKKGF